MPQTTIKTPSTCCDKAPEVFEIRPGDWVVHCKECWGGTMPWPTREQAVQEWEELLK